MDEHEEYKQNEGSAQPMENDLFILDDKDKLQPIEQSDVQIPAVSEVKPDEPKPEIVTSNGMEPAFETYPSSAAGTAPAKPVIQIHLNSAPNATLGSLLTDARNAAGYTVEQAAQLSRIKLEFIIALEKDTRDSTAAVFKRAYVKILAELYNLDAASSDLLREHFRELEPEKDVPEKVLQDIGKDVQISQEEARRVKLFCIYGGIILLLLISFTITCFVAVHISNAREQARQAQKAEVRPFETSRLENLLAPQMANPPVMNVPGSKNK